MAHKPTEEEQAQSHPRCEHVDTRFIAMGRDRNSIASVVPQYYHIACITSVHKNDVYPRSSPASGNTVNLRPKGGKTGQESSKSGIMPENKKKKELSDVQI